MHTFDTPRGNTARFHAREGTSDLSVLHSTYLHDEYGLADVTASGYALDIGAHIGSVAIALALDNPDLTVLAVEPLQDNVDVLVRNVAENGLADRVIVVKAAIAGQDGETQVASLTEGADRWIGGLARPGRIPIDQGNVVLHDVEAITLSRLIAELPEVAFAKMDCEACEWYIFADPALSKLKRIHGEFHDRYADEVVDILWDTHDVTILKNEGTLGLFRAVAL